MIYLAFGSNMGDRLLNIHNAYKNISKIGEIIKRSPIYENPALIMPGDNEIQGDYLNSVISFDTSLNPNALLFELKAIEKFIGPRSEKRWGERTLDIDILLFYDLIMKNENLTIPHPEIINRLFVLKPLLDVAGNISIPLSENNSISISKAIDNIKNNSLRYFADE